MLADFGQPFLTKTRDRVSLRLDRIFQHNRAGAGEQSKLLITSKKNNVSEEEFDDRSELFRNFKLFLSLRTSATNYSAIQLGHLLES